MLDGTRSFFMVTEAELDNVKRRLASADVHISGPLWGLARAELAAVQNLERVLLAEFGADLDGLENARVSADRRALRARVHDLSSCWNTDTELTLAFTLEPGVYATSLMRELLNEHQTRTKV